MLAFATLGSSISRLSALSSAWPCLPLGHAWSFRDQLALLSMTISMFGRPAAPEGAALAKRSTSSASPAQEYRLTAMATPMERKVGRYFMVGLPLPTGKCPQDRRHRRGCLHPA